MKQTLSAVEFLQSSCMSAGAVLLQHEEEKSTVRTDFDGDDDISGNDVSGNDGSSGIDNSKQIRENAARVALLLACSFVNFISKEDDSIAIIQHEHVLLSSISLEHVSVSFEQHGEGGGGGSGGGSSDSTNSPPPVIQELEEGFFSKFDGKGDAYQDYFKSMSNHNSSMDNTNTSDSMDNNMNHNMNNMSGGHHHPNGNSNSSSNPQHMKNGDHCCGIEKKKNITTLHGVDIINFHNLPLPTQYQPHPHGGDGDDDDDNAADHSFNLLQPHPTQPLSQSQPQSQSISQSHDVQQQLQYSSKTLQMQVLGKLLYSIFSLGKSPPVDLLSYCCSGKEEKRTKEMHSTTMAESESVITSCDHRHRHHDDDDDDDQHGHGNSNERSTKIMRSTEKTIFTRLLEEEEQSSSSSSSSYYAPKSKSICRFLSNMLDITTTADSSNSSYPQGSQGGPQDPQGKAATTSKTFKSQAQSSQAQSPCTSFDHIISDLEQMLAQPEIFLHDNSFYHQVSSSSAASQFGGGDDGNTSSPMMFGKRYHGKHGEVARLMRIAERIMDDDRDQDDVDNIDNVPGDGNNASDSHGNKDERGRQDREELIRRRRHHQSSASSKNNLKGVQAAFVSGMAGSGKSFLVKAVGESLLSSSRNSNTCNDGNNSKGRWISIQTKFERNMGHVSRGKVSSMFDGIVSHLVEMKNNSRDARDVEYGKRASQSIMDSIGLDALSGLVDFLPSLSALFDDIGNNNNSDNANGNNGNEEVDNDATRNTAIRATENDWQLVYSISEIIRAVLEQQQQQQQSSSPADGGGRRFLMICCDDLQWADKSAFSLISEVLINIGGCDIGRRCLFVGIYRHDEIDDDHSFSIQYSYLRASSSIHSTEIKVSSLSKEDVICMLMAEFKLPRRRVMELATVVHKKTSGHAIFVVQLLNSLIRDSIVMFSPEKQCYSWDPDIIDCIQMEDGVAAVISSSLKSLPPDKMEILQMLSCFGAQTDDSLLQLLDKFLEGTTSSIDSFVEQGILDRAGPIVIYSHDLIAKAVYDSMSADKQKSLHLRLGQFLGTSADVDCIDQHQPVLTILNRTTGLDQFHLKNQVFFAGNRNLASHLISVACDQVNALLTHPGGAGADPLDEDLRLATSSTSDDGDVYTSNVETKDDHVICDEIQKLQFAQWNLLAGHKSAQQSNFDAAFYYFSSGIAFLSQSHHRQSCKNDASLCLKLHNGAVSAAFALGEAEDVHRYAQIVIDRAPLEDSLEVQKIVLKSLTQSERHNECIERGIAILHQLNFNIPVSPSYQDVLKALAETSSVASQYSIDQSINLCQDTAANASTHEIIKIADAFYVSCYASASPILPLISCEVVKLSLQFGAWPESAVFFATFSMLKISINGDYDEGIHWANLAWKVTKSNHNKSMANKNSAVRAEILLHLTNDIYFMSPIDISSKLLQQYSDAMKIGQVDSSMIALLQAWRFRLLAGYNLSSILDSFENRLMLMAKHSKYSAKYMALDSTLLISFTGKSLDPFSGFGNSICSLEDLSSEAQSINDYRWLHNLHVYQMLLAYWSSDYMKAEKHFQIALTYPTSKLPQILLIYHTFYGGLISLRLFRQAGGHSRLLMGREMMDKVRKWAQNSEAIFGNKSLLLKAEYSFSVQEYGRAQLMYKDSIRSAELGNITHETALGYELFGDFHSSRGFSSDATNCYNNAYVYYTQWGSPVLAEKLLRKRKLGIDNPAASNMM